MAKPREQNDSAWTGSLDAWIEREPVQSQETPDDSDRDRYQEARDREAEAAAEAHYRDEGGEA